MNRTRCAVQFADAPPSRTGPGGGQRAELSRPEDLRPPHESLGGELSRIMLALKTLGSTDAPGRRSSSTRSTPGLAGVADVVGIRLQTLAKKFQVLCITHPQIAAHGGAHLHILKSVKQGRTLTRVQQLAEGDRQEELARMIGGSDVSAVVRASAREMLASRKTRAKGE